VITSFEKPLVLLVCKTVDLNLNQMNQHTSAPLLYDTVSVSLKLDVVQRKKPHYTFCVTVQSWLLSEMYILIPLCWTQRI